MDELLLVAAFQQREVAQSGASCRGFASGGTAHQGEESTASLALAGDGLNGKAA